MSNLPDLDIHRHAQDLRRTWQARALAEARGKEAAIVMAVLFHSYLPAMQILLRVVFPSAPLARNGWTEIARPFLYGGATIVNTGKVTCGMIGKDGRKYPRMLLFDREAQLVSMFRKLADRLKLNDAERIEMTEAVKRWVIADHRINHMGVKAVA